MKIKNEKERKKKMQFYNLHYTPSSTRTKCQSIKIFLTEQRKVLFTILFRIMSFVFCFFKIEKFGFFCNNDVNYQRCIFIF